MYIVNRAKSKKRPTGNLWITNRIEMYQSLEKALWAKATFDYLTGPRHDEARETSR